jgi:prolyl-tRNA synthetase
LSHFEKHWKDDNPGWLLTPWAGSREQEEKLSKKHKIAIRCIPNEATEGPEEPCLLTGTPTTTRALWGRSY